MHIAKESCKKLHRILGAQGDSFSHISSAAMTRNSYWEKFCITEEWNVNNFLPLKKF